LLGTIRLVTPHVMDSKLEPNFDDIVTAYYQPLHRFGYSLAKNEHEASGLVQQTFFISAEKCANGWG